MFKNNEGQVRSGWKIILAFGVFICLTTIILFICDELAINYVKSISGLSVESMNEKYIEIYSYLDKIYIIIQNIITIAVPIFFWKVISKRKLKDMGLTNLFKYKNQLLAGLIMGIISMSAVFILIIANGSGYVNDWTPKFTKDTIYYFIIFIFVGIGEETMTRGYFMSVLRQTKSMFLIFFISAVIFSLMHLFNSNFSLIPFINIVLVGLLFSYMYASTGSIWMPIGFHITWNYFQGCIFGFKVSGVNINGLITTNYTVNDIFNGGDFGPEGGLIATIVIIIGFIFVYFYCGKNKFDFLGMDN